MSGSLVSVQSFPGLVLLGIAVLASLNLFYRDRAEGEDPLHLIMTVIGRVMIVTGFVEACLLFLNFMALPFGIIFTGVLIYVAFRYLLRRRMALLAVMAAAARRWMPLAPAVEAFSHECRGPLGRRCRRLAELLDGGVALGDALRLAGPLSPARATALIEAGVRSGNLSGALQEAVRPTALQPVVVKVWGAMWYIGTFLLVGMAVMTFMMIKIVPAFLKIFDDFEAELPGPTVAVIQSCDWFVSYGWQPLVLALLGIGCFVSLHQLNVIAWLPPPLNALARRRETVVVLRALAVAAETDRPLEPALSALAEHYPSLAMRGRLVTALGQMSMGRHWAESLADQKLLRPGELALVSSAQRVGNLSWALREVADGIERRFALRMLRWLEVLVPALVLAAGVLVLFFVVGLFVPLISLIEKLT